ncbi:hypothetical protein BSKO_04256 [Bryopsis sp. KO-2023]|nr:hypothetical protein BSKO_04256 [Bryopsis sp. KO-2023]
MEDGTEEERNPMILSGHQENERASVQFTQPSFINPEHDMSVLDEIALPLPTDTLGWDEPNISDLDMNPLFETARDSQVPRQDVEENFRWEINHLYEFFKRLYDGEDHHMSFLARTLGEKDAQITSLRDALGVMRDMEARKPKKTETIKTKKSVIHTERISEWQPRDPPRREGKPIYCFIWSILALILAILLVWMIVMAASGGRETNPKLVFGPHIANTRKGGFDFTVSMNTAGWVDYLVIPTLHMHGKNPDELEPGDVAWSEVIWGASDLQVNVAACGTSRLSLAGANYTISISGGGTGGDPECETLEETLRISKRDPLLACHRCPQILGRTAYTVLVIGRSEGKRFTGVSHTTVVTTDAEAPVFAIFPSVSEITENSFRLALGLNEPGKVHYWIQYSSMMYVTQNGVGFSHRMMTPETTEMHVTGAKDFRGGIVANGTIDVPNAVQRVHLMVEDDFGNSQDALTKLELTTLPDTTPPDLMPDSGPRSITPTNFDMYIEQDEIGAFYYNILESGVQDVEVWSDFNVSLGGSIANGCVEVPRLSKTTTIYLNNTLSNDTVYKVMVITEDTWMPIPNRSLFPFEFLVRTADKRAPSFIKATPLVANVSYTTFDVLLSLNEEGLVFYAVTGEGEPVPTVDEIMTGTGEGFIRSGSVKITKPNEEVLVHISSVTPATTYIVYAVGQDTAEPPNVMPESRNATTRTSDNIPPNFLYIDTADIRGDSVDLIVQLDEPSNVSVALFPRTVTECPTADELFEELRLPAWSPHFQSDFVVSSGFRNATEKIPGLTSETSYRVCLGAEDLQDDRNRQPSTNASFFATLDITPPQLNATILNASVWANGFDLQVLLNETGYFHFLVAIDNKSEPLVPPSPQSMFDQQAEVEFATVANGTQTAEMGITKTVQVDSIPSETDFVIFVAAMDMADEPNLFPSTVELHVSTPDVTPPKFEGGTPSFVDINDTTMSFLIQLDEPGLVHFIVSPEGVAPPTLLELRSYEWNDTAITSRGNISVPTASMNYTTSISGLVTLVSYKLFLVAEDDTTPEPNRQSSLTALSFTTPDSSPPIFILLSAVYLPPSVYRVEFMLNEVGRVYMVGDKDNATRPSVADSFNLSWGNGGQAEIEGVANVTAPNVRFSIGGCGIDADELYHIYIVAEDDETPPNRHEEAFYRLLNTSATATDDLNCTDPSVLVDVSRPELKLSPGGPGFPVAASPPDQSKSSFQRRYSFLSNMVPGSRGEVTVNMGKTALPKASSPSQLAELQFEIKRLQPGKARSIVRTLNIFNERNSFAGREISIRYQLWDQYDRSQISKAGLSVVATLTIIGGSGGSNAIGECSLDSLSETTGIGNCNVLIDEGLLPAMRDPGIDADVHLEVRSGADALISSPPSRLRLFGWADCPSLTAIGMKAILPYRALFPGEEFVVTVTAHSPTTSLDQFFVPVYYDQTVVEYVRYTWDERWKEPTVTSVPGQGFLGLNNGGQAGGNHQYRGTEVPLLAVYYRVKLTAVDGTYDDIVGIGSVDNPLVLTSTSSGGAAINNAENKIAKICDQRGAFRSTGQITIEKVVPREIYAYTDQSELFNTAVLNGNTQTSSISAFQVNSWRWVPDDDVSSSLACSLVDGSSNALDLMGTGGRCSIEVNDGNTEGVDLVEILVEHFDRETKVSYRVWFPEDVRVFVDDNNLNMLGSRNLVAAACSRPLYQATTIHAEADFGGRGLTLNLNADISDIVSFTSSDPSVVEVNGRTAQGRALGSNVAVQIVGAISPVSTILSVTNDSICVTGLDAVAVTGVLLDENLIEVDPYQQLVANVEIVQELEEEGAEAYLAAYASFSDGTVLEVTNETTFTSARQNYLQIQNKSSSTDPTTAIVTAKMGDPRICGRLLTASWDICNVTFAIGSVPVEVNLPSAVNITEFSVSAVRITTRDPVDAAASPPINIPLESALTVVVLFSDGVSRDMSTDDRLQFSVVTGSSKCEVFETAPGAAFAVRTTSGSTAFGPCQIEVSIPAFGNPGLIARADLEVVGVDQLLPYLLHYDVSSLSGDLATISEPSYGPETLQKLICGAQNYEQAGAITLTASFAGLSATNSVAVDDSAPLSVTSFELSSNWCKSGTHPQCQLTFSGIQMEETTLQARVVLEDGYVFSEPLLGDANVFLDILDVGDVLQFSSDTPSAITTRFLGDVVLVQNHDDVITLTGTTSPGCTGSNPAIASAVQVYANLEPDILDADLGEQYGLQFQKQPNPTPAIPVELVQGDTFVMDVVVNSLGVVLQAFQIKIEFDDSIMRVAGCSSGADWPDPNTFVCAFDLPGLTHQAMLNAQDTATTASSLKTSRVRVGHIEFDMVGSGQGTVEATVDARQKDGTLRSNFLSIAAKSMIRVLPTAGRRRLISLPAAKTMGGYSLPYKGRRLQRKTLQTCDEATHKLVYGDINFDCKFEFVTDSVLMAEIFGEWNPDLPNFPQRYFDALALKSAQTINGGATDWQRMQLDPLLRFFARLAPSDPLYPWHLPRPDATKVPDLVALTGNQIPSRPGFKDDVRLLQLISVGLNFFPQGLNIVTPDELNPYLNITLILRDVNSQLLTEGSTRALVQFELKSTQTFVFVNPSANPVQKSTETLLATADYEGNGRFSVSMKGSAVCDRFLDEELQASYFRTADPTSPYGEVHRG